MLSNTAMTTHIIRPNATGTKTYKIYVTDVKPDMLKDLRELLAKCNVTKWDGNMAIIKADWELGDDFKRALEEAGYSWLFHGSKWQGTADIPAEMKGAIVFEPAVVAKVKIGDALHQLHITYTFIDKVLRHPAYFHPLFIPNMMEELGVPWPMIQAWKNENLSSECARRAVAVRRLPH